MIGLHLRLARRSLRRTPGFTAVMFGLLTLGVAGWYAPQVYIQAFDKVPLATRTRLHGVDRGREARLAPRRGAALALHSRLAVTLLEAAGADRLWGSGLPSGETMTFAARVLHEVPGKPPARVRVRFCTRDFFSLFALDFAAGAPWASESDAGGVRGGDGPGAVVIGPELARELFGETGAVGQTISLGGHDFRVAGVLTAELAWTRRMFDPDSLEQPAERIYLPVASAARLAVLPELRYDQGHAPGSYPELVASSSGFILYFAELADEASKTAFLARTHAQFGERARLLDPPAWHSEVMRDEGSIRAWPLMASLTLVAAALNLVRLLLAKFSGRHLELGLLRAFGASRGSLVAQLLLEAGLLGLAAGVTGTLLGLLVAPLAAGAMPPGLVAHTFTPRAALASLLGAPLVALAAALYPAWRSSRPSPAQHLRRA